MDLKKFLCKKFGLFEPVLALNYARFGLKPLNLIVHRRLLQAVLEFLLARLPADWPQATLQDDGTNLLFFNSTKSFSLVAICDIFASLKTRVIALSPVVKPRHHRFKLFQHNTGM